MLRHLLLASLGSALASAARGTECSEATTCDKCVGGNVMTGNSQECYWCESEMACVDSDTFTSMPLSECRTTAFDLAQCKTDRHESTLGLGSTFNWGNLFQGGDSAEVGTLAPDPETGDEVTNEAEEVSRVTSPPSAPPTPVPAAAPTDPAVMSSKRCDELGWTTSNGRPDVCAESEINAKCYPSVTYKEADALCTGVGARLCTKAELTLGETKNTGCKLDASRVWSSSSCAGGVQTAAGSYVYDDLIPAECSPPSDYNAARCCADAQAQVASVSCFALGWDFSSSGAALGVCSESKISGACTLSKTKTQMAAANFCSKVGARLCSAAELEADVAIGSGCKLDQEWVWSLSPCEDGSGRYQASGGSSLAGLSTQCLSTDIELGARCCADA